MAPPNPIFQLFGRSPIRPLQEHMAKVQTCVEALVPFFDAMLHGDWTQAETHQQLITKLEQEADTLKHDIRQHLPHGLFLPAPRVDLLQMLNYQDKLANKAKDIAGLAFGRKMSFPESVAAHYLRLLKRCIDTSLQAQKAIDELDALLETGFKGIEANFVNELLVELGKIEHETDNIQVEVRSSLFAIEDKYSPIDIMFLYKVIDWTGELADGAQKLAGQIEIIIAR